MLPSFFLVVLAILLLGSPCPTGGKPTIYVKNENDKLEPVLLPVSSTVIPIPIGYYQQVRAGVGVHNGKLTKQKIKLTKPSGPGKLITAAETSSPDASKASSQIEVVQNLFGEILQIQKDNRTPDEAINRIQEIILQSGKAVENSTSPNEMIVDAKILQTGSSYINANVTSLNTNLTAFNESKYVSGLLSHLENSNRVPAGGKEWAALSPVTYKMFKKSHPLSFLLGTLAFEPPPPKEKATTERKQTKKGTESEKKVLSSEGREKQRQKEEGNDVYDHIFKWLLRRHKQNGRKPVCYFSFILDPDSYWRTIENIFHFAFLVRDGNVKMEIASGLPTAEPLLKSREEETVTKALSGNQFCFTLSMKDWRESVERFQIRSPSIPPFAKAP